MRLLAPVVALLVVAAPARSASFDARAIEVAVDPGLVRIDGLGVRLRFRVGGGLTDWCRIEGTLGHDRERDSALRFTTLRACIGSFEDEGLFLIVGYGHGWGHEEGDPRGGRDAPLYELGMGSGGQLRDDGRATFRFEMTLSGCGAMDREIVPAATFGFGWLLGGPARGRL